MRRSSLRHIATFDCLPDAIKPRNIVMNARDWAEEEGLHREWVIIELFELLRAVNRSGRPAQVGRPSSSFYSPGHWDASMWAHLCDMRQAACMSMKLHSGLEPKLGPVEKSELFGNFLTRFIDMPCIVFDHAVWLRHTDTDTVFEAATDRALECIGERLEVGLPAPRDAVMARKAYAGVSKSPWYRVQHTAYYNARRGGELKFTENMYIVAFGLTTRERARAWERAAYNGIRRVYGAAAAVHQEFPGLCNWPKDRFTMCVTYLRVTEPVPVRKPKAVPRPKSKYEVFNDLHVWKK